MASGVDGLEEERAEGRMSSLGGLISSHAYGKERKMGRMSES